MFYQVYGGRDIVGENYRTLSVKRTMKFCNVSIYSTIVPLVQDIFIFRLAAKQTSTPLGDYYTWLLESDAIVKSYGPVSYLSSI